MATKILNKKIHYSYFIEKQYCAGIILQGSEVKAIKDHKINISEGFCIFENNELILKNVNISTINNEMFGHNENRDKKLLLNKKELKQIRKWIDTTGNAVIPEYVLIPDSGFIKIYISLCKGKHDYDKRETIKKRDLERELKNE